MGGSKKVLRRFQREKTTGGDRDDLLKTRGTGDPTAPTGRANVVKRGKGGERREDQQMTPQQEAGAERAGRHPVAEREGRLFVTDNEPPFLLRDGGEELPDLPGKRRFAVVEKVFTGVPLFLKTGEPFGGFERGALLRRRVFMDEDDPGAFPQGGEERLEPGGERLPLCLRGEGVAKEDHFLRLIIGDEREELRDGFVIELPFPSGLTEEEIGDRKRPLLREPDRLTGVEHERAANPQRYIHRPGGDTLTPWAVRESFMNL